MITEADSSSVIDRSKIRRHEQMERHAVVRESKERNLRNIKSLYFDGRIDKNTKVKCEHLGEVRYKTRPQEHITVVAQPGDVYIDHVTPYSGKAVHFANEVEGRILENELHIIVLGGDGTSISTGRVGGVFRIIEIALG